MILKNVRYVQRMKIFEETKTKNKKKEENKDFKFEVFMPAKF